MKKTISLLAILCALLISPVGAVAQGDPSGSLLVRPSLTPSDDSEANLDNGRYVIKPSPTPTSQPKPARKVAPVAAAKTETPVATAPPTSTSPGPAAPSTVDNRNFSDAVQDLLLGGANENLGHYKEKLQTDDQRLNILTFSVAPTYFYIDSESSYWFRRFSSGGPGVSSQADIWMTPFIGLDLTYFTTLAADVKADPSSNRTILADHSYTGVNFLFRKYFTLSKKSPSLTFGLGYNEYRMTVAQNEANRIRLLESGLDLSLRFAAPTSSTHAWELGSEIIPKMTVSEQTTGTTAHSGTSPTSYALKFTLGEDFNLDRNNRVFWRLSHRIEKSVYSGSASVVDPSTGTTPSGVSVTTGVTMFELGYSWGD